MAAEATPNPASQTFTVAVVQMRSSTNLTSNVLRIQGFLQQAAAKGARVAVFPECALSGYFEHMVTNLSPERIAQAERDVAEACRQNSIYAIVGLPYREGDKLFNSASVISPEGKVLERYHKVQLAEGWPAPGNHLSVFKIEGVPCSIIICHDERYPELVRLPVLAGSKLIFYLSHESPLQEEHKLVPYRAQIQARAVENTVYVAQANAPANIDATGSHGQSRLIAPDGNIIREASVFQEELLVQTLDMRKASRANAKKSLSAGPLQDWWQSGVQRVRIIE